MNELISKETHRRFECEAKCKSNNIDIPCILFINNICDAVPVGCVYGDVGEPNWQEVK